MISKDVRARRAIDRRWIGVAWAVSAGMCHVAATQAAEWRVEPAIDIASLYDDNVELTTAPHDSASGYLLGPRLGISRATETSKTRLDAHAVFTNYRSGDVEDTTETTVFLTDDNQLSERGTFGIDGEWRSDALFQRITQAPTGVGDLRDTDVGLTTSSEVRRKYLAVRPRYRWLLSERSALQLSYRLTDVSFEKQIGTDLVDYREHLASIAYSYDVTEKNTATLSANFVRYDPDLPNTKTNTYQLLAGLDRKFTENSHGWFAIGGSRTTQTESGQDDTDSGVALETGFTKKSDLSTVDAVLSRDVTPSGVGQSVVTNQFRVRWLRRLSEAMSFELRGQFFRNRELRGSGAGIDRHYYEIEPQLSWQWLEHWAVSGSYRYRNQKYDAESNAADSNAVFLGLSYSLY